MENIYLSGIKRVGDFIFAFSALLILSPLLLVVAIGILLEDGFPIVFRQKRVGRGGQEFTIFKFRSMPTGTGDVSSREAKQLTITKIGKFIRRTNIDELPQLFNILNGSMSLIGPRPALASQTELVTARHLARVDDLRPGMTGLAQVNSYENMPEKEKVAWDTEYRQTVSLATDIKILLRTYLYLLGAPRLLMKYKKLGFVTCVELGLECMRAIYDAGVQLEIALTLNDNIGRQKSGRVYLDEFCIEHSLDLRKVRNLNDPEAVETVKEAGIDWLFIIGWSQIAKAEILNGPKLGCVGIHPTLLPQGRGRAAIPWAILKGLDKTGVTLFKLDEGVDTGPILDQIEIPLSDSTDAERLYQQATQAHYRIIRNNLEALLEGTHHLLPQDEQHASEWPSRRPEDGRICTSMTCRQAGTLVRAVTHPYPGAFFDLPDKRIRVWKVGEARQSSSDFEVRLADGQLYCTDWEAEALAL